jgi:uncharacterized protein (TIGR03067 family)
MRRFLPLAFLLAAGFAPMPFPRPDPSKEDLKKLQGEWHRVRHTISGGLRSESTSGITILIAGDRMKYAVDGKPAYEWVCTLDRKTRPMRFDRKRPPGAASAVIFWGIYRLEGDTLTLCWHDGERPIDFSETRAGAYTEVFERKKP